MTTTDGTNLYALQAERTILGSMILDPDCFVEASTLEASAFYLSSHRGILGVLLSMHAAGQYIDEVTLAEELRRRHLLEHVGGVIYIHDLTADVPRKPQIDAYIRIVREKAALRSIIEACASAQERAQEADPSAGILEALQRSVVGVQTQGEAISAQHIADCCVPTWEQIKDEMNTVVGSVIGIPTGIHPLDLIATGWRDGELTYVGAPPGTGKTAFMLQCMHFAASREIGVGCISLEMRGSQLVKRLAIIQSGIHAGKWRDPRNIPVGDRKHARDSIFALAALPIWIADQSGLNPRQITALALKMYNSGARIIFVDFVQIIEETGHDRREAINRISAALRDACKALGIPFVVLSQLARGDKDKNRRPRKEDLRESGNLEQDAHNVMLLYRPKDEKGQYTGDDEIIIDKARESVIGPILVTFDTASLTYRARGPQTGSLIPFGDPTERYA